MYAFCVNVFDSLASRVVYVHVWKVDSCDALFRLNVSLPRSLRPDWCVCLFVSSVARVQGAPLLASGKIWFENGMLRAMEVTCFSPAPPQAGSCLGSPPCTCFILSLCIQRFSRTADITALTRPIWTPLLNACRHWYEEKLVQGLAPKLPLSSSSSISFAAFDNTLAVDLSVCEGLDLSSVTFIKPEKWDARVRQPWRW